MARKPTKTQLREQARQAFEQCQREKSYAIIKIENERGWGFVEEASPVLILNYAPPVDLTMVSCLAYAFDRDTAERWAERVEREKGVKATVIPVEEKWETLRYSYNKVPMAQRYVVNA